MKTKILHPIIVLFFLFQLSCSNKPKETYEAVDTSVVAEDPNVIINRHRESILRVLQQDSEASKRTNFDNITTPIEMRKIDLINCPTDFATAYTKHIHAWEDASEIQKAQNELKENGKDALALAVIARLSGSNATPILDYIESENELKRLSKITSQKISDTWRDIELISLEYGIQIPK